MHGMTSCRESIPKDNTQAALISWIYIRHDQEYLIANIYKQLNVENCTHMMTDHYDYYSTEDIME